MDESILHNVIYYGLRYRYFMLFTDTENFIILTYYNLFYCLARDICCVVLHFKTQDACFYKPSIFKKVSQSHW